MLFNYMNIHEILNTLLFRMVLVWERNAMGHGSLKTKQKRKKKTSKLHRERTDCNNCIRNCFGCNKGRLKKETKPGGKEFLI